MPEYLTDISEPTKIITPIKENIYLISCEWRVDLTGIAYQIGILKNVATGAIKDQNHSTR